MAEKFMFCVAFPLLFRNFNEGQRKCENYFDRNSFRFQEIYK